ncbi:MAG: hypothetical protein RR788_07975 [Erysipelotrichaceae bacterium]
MYNSFCLYLAVIIELVAFILLQGEFNAISITLLMILSIVLCNLGYRLGCSEGGKKE